MTDNVKDFKPNSSSNSLPMQSIDESQILCFMIDLMVSLRKAASKGSLSGSEWRVMKPALRIVLSCLPCLSEPIADRVGVELLAYLKYMSDASAPLSADRYKAVLMQILNALRSVIEDSLSPEYLRTRYTAIVFAIMHFFVDIRHSLAMSSSTKVKVPDHVQPVLNDLVGVINCNDIDLIFKLMDVTMRTADSISFADETDIEGPQEVESAKESNTIAEIVGAEDMVANNTLTKINLDQQQSASMNDRRIVNFAASDTDNTSEINESILVEQMSQIECAESITAKNIINSVDDPFSMFDSDAFAVDDQVNECDSELLSIPPHIETSHLDTKSSNPLEESIQISKEDVKFSTPQAPALTPLIAPQSATSHLDKVSREQKYLKWLSIRQGISSERIDTERARLARSMDTLDLSFQATNKFFRNCRRKIESECFKESHRCQWKLGVAHEGHFPGRRRLVFRPRIENEYGEVYQVRSPRSSNEEFTGQEVMSPGGDRSFSAELNTSIIADDDFNTVRALAIACAGYIKDVTIMDTVDSNTPPPPPDSHESRLPIGNNSPALVSIASSIVPTTTIDSQLMHSPLPIALTQIPVPGTGWGLVDADDSEEGFGVVGVAQTASSDIIVGVDGNISSLPDAIHETYKVENNPASTVNPGIATSGSSAHLVDDQQRAAALDSVISANDMMGDIRQLEESIKQARNYVETSPCHSGTRRVGSGPPKMESRVIMVTASGNFWGTLSFNGKEIFFSSSLEPEDGHKDDSAAVNLVKRLRMRRRRWVLSSLSAVYLRRFRLRDSAMEVFFMRGKHRNFFVDFGHTREDAKHRNEFARMLMAAAPPTAFKQTPNMSAFRLVYEHGIQEKWLQGKVSNFDYLMALNTIAGRTYNDLCQYPVFPWVISDYSSTTLDLSNPAVYRDLTKPMGALNESRLSEFLDRFHSFEENVTTGIPAFMYGSHYSTMVGVVLHFLVRLQPFAALHKEMQNGHFDVPDRLFSSIPRSFKHNTNQLSEVKELTPEWFTTPEMFKNINNFNLGITQDNEIVDDVELPPWASTAEEFVRINAQALESDYVTQNLHHWIDLIFGYKQRGPESVEANNVFFYLTYYGAVNHYLINDESLRRATELQIAHFGQTPMQLFKTPHPSRVLITANTSAASGGQSAGPASNSTSMPPTRLLQKCFAHEDWAPASCDEEAICIDSACTLISKGSSSKVINLAVLNDRVICLVESGVIDVLKYSTSEVAKYAIAAYAAEMSKVTAANPSLPVSATGKGGSFSSSSSDSLSIDSPSIENKKELAAASIAMMNASNDFRDSEQFDVVPSFGNRILPKKEPLIFIAKELTHFELLPRVPLMKVSSLLNAQKKRSDVNMPYFEEIALASDESKTETIAKFTHFTKSSSLIITFGHIDGRVCVRELDPKTGFVRSCGEYRAHKKRVVALSTDCIPHGNTDVVVSCDEGGRVMIWTVSKIRSTGNVVHSYVISRRPQRLFRCECSPRMGAGSVEFNVCCDISWQMGVIVVASGAVVSLMSIERDEMIRSFSVRSEVIKSESQPSQRITCTGFVESLAENRNNETLDPFDNRVSEKEILWTRRVVISDEGRIILHLEEADLQATPTKENFDLLLEYDSPVTSPLNEVTESSNHRHSLLSYSMSGCLTGIASSEYLSQHHSIASPKSGLSSPITFLSCPDRGNVVIAGQQDGSVVLYLASNLSIIFKFKPHLCCTLQTLQVSLSSSNSSSTGSHLASAAASSSSSNRGNTGSTLREKDKERGRSRSISQDVQHLSVAASPVLCVRIGPNKQSPAVICVTTESGNIFFRALPDFYKWEKNRTPSALAQLAAVPLQAVKGTIQQAQNWTAETAGVLAQNAKSLAEELKKMNKSAIVKNVSNFFGFGTSKPNETDNYSSKK
mmetsp:Transcript_32207/g.44173  ORF Transcript_32207/g.44173 Transcript_32207/m.44173 type:complete len:1891 (+) Transcript_32207:3429-9101(+)